MAVLVVCVRRLTRSAVALCCDVFMFRQMLNILQAIGRDEKVGQLYGRQGTLREQ